MADQTTVGDVRAFLAQRYDVPHTDSTHYVIVAQWPDSMLVNTCCDDTALVADLLNTVLDALGVNARALAADSPSVIVRREDLEQILSISDTPAEVLARLREALVEVNDGG